jgi:hypothetical protein
MQRTFIWLGKCTFENFASRATDATRRDKAWNRAGKLRLVSNRTIIVAVLISPRAAEAVCDVILLQVDLAAAALGSASVHHL